MAQKPGPVKNKTVCLYDDKDGTDNQELGQDWIISFITTLSRLEKVAVSLNIQKQTNEQKQANWGNRRICSKWKNKIKPQGLALMKLR